MQKSRFCETDGQKRRDRGSEGRGKRREEKNAEMEETRGLKSILQPPTVKRMQDGRARAGETRRRGMIWKECISPIVHTDREQNNTIRNTIQDYVTKGQIDFFKISNRH